MRKKIFVSNARIVRGDRWTLDYSAYNAETGQDARQRKDFLLNDIADLEQRELVAAHLVKVLDQLLTVAVKAAPKPVTQPVEAGFTVAQAVEQALKAKSKLRPDSVRSYKSVAKQFMEWAAKCSYASMPVSEFSKKHIKSFTDWCRNEYEYRERTMNNKLNAMQALWTEIEEREHVTSNPWLKAKRGRVEAKTRRAFAEGDKKILADYIYEHDYWLYKAVLLLYFCYVRQSEICRLRFRDFNFADGTITITEHQSKTHKKRVATIPTSIRHHFIDGQFDKYPGSYFVLGEHWKPNAKKALDPDSINKRHRRVLARLNEKGLIPDITGYVMYSWKDTGITLHARKTSALATKDQAGHSDMAMTMVYYHEEVVNQEYQALENDLH